MKERKKRQASGPTDSKLIIHRPFGPENKIGQIKIRGKVH